MAGVAADTASTALAVTGSRAEGMEAMTRLPPGSTLLRFKDLRIRLPDLVRAYHNTRSHAYGK